MKRTKDYLVMLGIGVALVVCMAVAQDQVPLVAPPVAPVAEGEAQQQAAPRVRGAARPTAGMRTVAPPTVGGGVPPTRRVPLVAPQAARGLAGITTDDSDAADFDDVAGEGGGEKTTTTALKFDNAPADIIVAAYCEQTGKTALWNPEAPKSNITLKSQPGVELSKEEYIEAIEVVLGMNGIALEPFGEKFIKVLPRKTIRTDGILPVLMGEETGVHPEKGRMISQMIQLKAITAAEAQKALDGFKKPDGLFQIFERTNSILVTDTQENVNRMVEIVKFIDQPLPVTEEVFHRPISYAKAEEIKKRIEEVVAESQKQSEAKEEVRLSPTGAPGMVRTAGTTPARRPLPPGLTRLGQQAAQPESPAANEVLSALISDADRGMIRGKVQIIADERTNQLIIITRPENMTFFDRIISVLDIETAPDFKVEVRRLEFADAEEVSTMLNDLIGNVSAGKKEDAAPATAARGPASEAGGRSTTLAEAAAARASRSATTAGAADAGASKLGQLSKDNIKILADKRTNAIVMMGSPNDLAAIEEIIKNMDIQLSQVLIETVVLQVGLSDSIQTGIDWVKRMKPTTRTASVLSGFDDAGAPIYTQQEVDRGSNYRYTMGGGGGTRLAQNLWEMGTNMVSIGGSGIEYMATIKNLRLDAVISAAKTDSTSKILSSPVLLTVDNKEATLEATQMRYMFKGMRYMGYSSYGGNTGGYEPDVEQREIGLTVKVTPRISPSGNVILTVEETFENIGEDQEIPGQSGGTSQKWPTVITRKLSADVSVGDGETVILGGLVETSKKNSESGIPILKDIPFVGKYLFGSVKVEESRSELLVFLTPYVINSPEDMDREARRRKDYINANDIWTKGWSDSKLADPVSEKEMKQRLEQKRAIENAWRKYREGLEEQQEVEEALIDERSRTEALSKEQASANFAREAAGYKPVEKKGEDEEAPMGTLRVSESVEVLRPPSMSDEEYDALLRDAGEIGTGSTVREPAKKSSWWKFW